MRRGIGPRGVLLEPCRAEADCIRATSCVGEPGATYCTVNFDGDVDCDASSTCDTSTSPARCVARLGPTGASWATGGECVSGVCLDGLCALPCEPRTACAPGLVCTPRSEGAFCEPAPVPMIPPMEMAGCGCHASTAASWRGTLAAALFGLWVGRRRSRAPRRSS